jgi:hypothetical protein
MAKPTLAKPDFSDVIQITISTASAKVISLFTIPYFIPDRVLRTFAAGESATPQPKEFAITIPAH